MAVAIPLAIVWISHRLFDSLYGLANCIHWRDQPERFDQWLGTSELSGRCRTVAGLAAGLGLVWLVKLLYIDAAVSPGGAGLIYVTSTARILYAMSQIGYLPRWLQYLK